MPGRVVLSLGRLVRSALGEAAPVTTFYVGWCCALFAVRVVATGAWRGLGGVGPMRDFWQWGGLGGGWGALGSGPVGQWEPWRYLSAMSLHLGAIHLLLNMTALWQFGRALEREIRFGRFAVTFLGSGALGFFVSDLWNILRGADVPTAGASGGLFGIAAAVVGYQFARRDPRYKALALQLVVFAIVFAWVLDVNSAAHIGGALAGAPLGYWFCRERNPHRHDAGFAWAGGVLVFLSIVSVAASQVSL
jgi:membrane associated rhomboid family serine protease